MKKKNLKLLEIITLHELYIIKNCFPEYLKVLNSIRLKYSKKRLVKLFKVFNLRYKDGVKFNLKFIHFLDYYIINKRLPRTKQSLDTLPKGETYYGRLYGKTRKIESEWAYKWALNIGDKEIMRDKIEDSEWVYWWAKTIGDREIMRDRIKDSEWAYIWADDIGDKDIMRDKITENHWAYKWALNIGDKEIMRDKIKNSYWAYTWAMEFGDKKIMQNKITESKWAYWWARDIGDRKIMKLIVSKEEKCSSLWNKTFPNDKIKFKKSR